MVEIASRNSGVYARLLMGRAWHAMLNARQKEVAPYHVFPRQAYLISILYKLGHKATLSELAKYAGRGINTLSTELKIMEKDGLVKKTRQTPKSNLLTIEITEKGIETYRNTKKSKSEKAIMSVLSEEECQHLISLLNKIIQKAESYK